MHELETFVEKMTAQQSEVSASVSIPAGKNKAIKHNMERSTAVVHLTKRFASPLSSVDLLHCLQQKMWFY